MPEKHSCPNCGAQMPPLAISNSYGLSPPQPYGTDITAVCVVDRCGFLDNRSPFGRTRESRPMGCMSLVRYWNGMNRSSANSVGLTVMMMVTMMMVDDVDV